MSAVLLFLEATDVFHLELEVPAPLESGSGLAQYEDNGTLDWRTNPGGTSNHYLRQYANQCEEFTHEMFPWVDLFEAINHPRAKVTVTHGFKQRNSLVAQADHCLAMTFGDGPLLKDGGTADTMGKFLARPGHGNSYHFDLTAMRFYVGARI